MLERHPLPAAFPDPNDEEFQALRESIKNNGQREKIVTFEGKILDGWHRHKACIELGIDPKFGVFAGNAIDFVLDKNLLRRHLTPSQWAMALATCNAWRGIGSNQYDKVSYQQDSSLSIRELADLKHREDATA